MSFPIKIKPRNLVIKGLAVLALSFAGVSQVFALPAFARQTGDSCDACHVGAYGPQLTPHGMKFKLGGYTDSDGKKGHKPFSAMLIENFTHTKDAQDPAPEGYGNNNNDALQELSVFASGKIADHVGTFTQVTYSDIDRLTVLDNTEFRYASEGNLFGQDAVWGVTLNNNPTMQDPFNTLPAWRFPYTSSDLAKSPESAPMLDDGIAGTVYGVTAYTLLKNGIYAELGNYFSFGRGFLEKVNNLAAEDPYARTTGMAPYARVAYYKDMHKQVYSVGLVTMSAKLRDEAGVEPDLKQSDIGIDGHYQYLGNRKNIYSFDGSYIDESNQASGADKTKLHQLSLAGSYYYDKTYGGTLRIFDTTGSDPADNSKGMTLQGDWTPFGKENSPHAPWANIRVGLQYTTYNELNGNSSASGDNTLMAFLWAAI